MPTRGMRGLPTASRGVTRGRGAAPMAMRGVGRASPNPLGVRGGGIVKRGANPAAQMMQGRGGMMQTRGGTPVRGAPQGVPRGRGATSTVQSSKGAISITHVRDGAPPPPRPPQLRQMRPGPGPQQVIFNHF